jgi:hypothetical protein
MQVQSGSSVSRVKASPEKRSQSSTNPSRLSPKAPNYVVIYDFFTKLSKENAAQSEPEKNWREREPSPVSTTSTAPPIKTAPRKSRSRAIDESQPIDPGGENPRSNSAAKEYKRFMEAFYYKDLDKSRNDPNNKVFYNSSISGETMLDKWERESRDGQSSNKKRKQAADNIKKLPTWVGHTSIPARHRTSMEDLKTKAGLQS